MNDKNSDRLLTKSKRHPVLICMILRKGMPANSELLQKVYSYSEYSACPIYVNGSRRNFETISKIGGKAVIQRSDMQLMQDKIQELCSLYRNGEIKAFNNRYETTVIISDNAASLAFFENKISKAPLRQNIITATPECSEREYEYLDKINMSGIITDKPLTPNSLKLFTKASKAVVPAVLIDTNEHYGKRNTFHHIDSDDKTGEIAKLITQSAQRRSKLLFIRNHKNKDK